MNPTTQKKTIFKINMNKTFAQIKEFIDKMPPHERNGKIHRPIKGNVNSTAYHIYRTFIGKVKKAAKIVAVFKTNNSSLAKVSNNCERTIRRHILKLIDLGILKEKARAGHGIQLFLNEALLAFDEIEVVKHQQPTASASPAAAKAPDMATLMANMAAQMRAKFSPGSTRTAFH